MERGAVKLNQFKLENDFMQTFPLVFQILATPPL